MAKVFEKLLYVILSSVFTLIFGYILYRTQVVDKKADVSYVDKKFEIFESANNKAHEMLMREDEKSEIRQDIKFSKIDKKLDILIENAIRK